MPADTIPSHFTTQYEANWIHRLNQKRARLEAYVEFEDFDGERKRYDRIGSMASNERTERKGPTRITDATDDSRWAYRKSYDLANLLDKDDAKNLGQLVLPTSSYIAEHAAAYNRDFDDMCWKTASGAVMTGEAGSTSTPFPTATNFIGKDGTVGSNTGTAAGLTVAKLITAREILGNADADDEAPMVICVTTRQISDLLNTTEVKSADYNTVKALAAGSIKSFCGFDFVIIKRLPLASQLRTCVAWVKGSVKAIKGAKKSQISIRTDLSYATQIYSEWYLGGTRVHDEGVVTLDCKEV